MTTIPSIVDEAERLVRGFAEDLTRVRDGECLCCYLWRQLDESPCDNTYRLALRYRDAVAPRATALLKQLDRVGARCCDCELFLNGYAPHPRLWTPERQVEDERNGGCRIIDAQPPNVMPACAGVRRGSVQPCDDWVRQRYGY